MKKKPSKMALKVWSVGSPAERMAKSSPAPASRVAATTLWGLEVAVRGEAGFSVKGVPPPPSKRVREYPA